MTTTTPSWRPLKLPAHVDERGSLSVAEQPDIPFDIRRVYYLYDLTPGAQRGAHATFGSQQLLIPVRGGFDITVQCGFYCDTRKEKFRLDRPVDGLLIESGVWRELDDFAPGTVVLVLSSTTYADTEYCRDYEDWRRRVTHHCVC